MGLLAATHFTRPLPYALLVRGTRKKRTQRPTHLEGSKVRVSLARRTRTRTRARIILDPGDRLELRCVRGISTR